LQLPSAPSLVVLTAAATPQPTTTTTAIAMPPTQATEIN
jgi:hypothetical protein